MTAIKHDLEARARHRIAVLRALGAGPRRGDTLRDMLAVHCGGTRENVGSALNWLRDHGLAKTDGVAYGRATWSITDVGAAWVYVMRDVDRARLRVRETARAA